MKLLRGCVALAVPLLYVAHVLQISDDGFWRAGLAYWLDPYFINGLLEHWYVTVTEGADPSSPPMYFPARGTLGYSHGLVLFAPFYVPFRLFLHPFLAHNWMVFAVLATGCVCLYALFRRMGLSFAEALVLSALFYTSRNVVNEPLSAWTQRASVFLIPPILLLLFVSWRARRTGRWTLAAAGVGGCLATLMYVQDFYTAHLALLFVALFAGAAAFAEGAVQRLDAPLATFARAQTRLSTLALIVGLIAAAWAAYLMEYGGGAVEILGVRIRSNDVWRPAAVSAVALGAFLWANRRVLRVQRIGHPDPWWSALALGAAVGAAVFLWMYAAAYLEHRAFPEQDLLSQLLARDPDEWRGALDALRRLDPYDSLRSFALVGVVGVLVWLPPFGAGRRARIYWSCLAAVSLVVFFVPLRIGEFSVWRTVIEPIPGYRVIRDPKRIVYLYELAVAVAAAAAAASLERKSALRAAIVLVAIAAVVTSRGPDVFRYHRSMAVFDRWVAAPISMDPSCASFYVKGASREYMSRSDNMWGQYNVDALFIALRLGIPTLNGYSAWAPEGWNLMNPHESWYEDRVTAWIERHGLTAVCGLDIDTRRMVPHQPSQ